MTSAKRLMAIGLAIAIAGAPGLSAAAQPPDDDARVADYYAEGEFEFKLMNTVAAYLAIDVTVLTRKSNLVTGFGADETDLLELLWALEELVGTELPGTLFDVTQTFGQLADYLKGIAE